MQTPLESLIPVRGSLGVPVKRLAATYRTLRIYMSKQITTMMVRFDDFIEIMKLISTSEVLFIHKNIF